MFPGGKIACRKNNYRVYALEGDSRLRSLTGLLEISCCRPPAKVSTRSMVRQQVPYRPGSDSASKCPTVPGVADAIGAATADV